MPGKDKKKKKQNNYTGFLNDFVDVERPEREAIPELEHYNSNELNLQFSILPSSANESIHEEAEHKKKEHQKRGAVKDQNGPAPQQMPEPEPIQEPQINQQIAAPAQLNGLAPQQNQANAFVPQQTARSKWSKTAQANNAVWRTVGSTIGRASVLPASLGGMPIMARIKHNAHEKAKNGQQTRNHSEIPGRDGEKFDPEKTSGADILEDFRRVPTVWSYLTAGKAVDNQGNDIAPKVTVYVEQPKTGSSRSMHFLEMGHTMLGIEYTRNSKITGHKERYNIKYGFYPAGGLVTLAGTEMMLKGAVIPGQLVDDATHTYDISKSYTATRNQIEEIAKASESYTEQGGYGYYTRNCTTFVRDMFRAGHLPEGAINSIFTEEKVRFNSAGHTGLVFANAWNCFYNTSLQSKMGDLASSADLSYQGWGNKRVTTEDFERYRNTKNTAGFGITSLAPASAGENMRRMTDSVGQLGSFRHAPAALRKNPKDNAKAVLPATYQELLQGIREESNTLLEQIDNIMTPEEKNLAGMDFKMWHENLRTYGSGLARLNSIVTSARAKMTEEEAAAAQTCDLTKPEDLKAAHASISDEIAEVSMYYQTVLGSDSRLNKAVMNLLSALEISLRMIDKMYTMRDKAEAIGEIGTIRENMLMRGHTITVGEISVTMTPSHYEAYLQIYKTPLEAVKAYNRYLELKRERKDNDKNLKKLFSNQKLAEWKLLSRNEELADQFDNAHKTMLNKDTFEQEDIDYAFNLTKKEMSGKRARNTSAADSEMYTSHSTASEIYMALFFDKIFGGIYSTAVKPVKEGGVPKTANIIPIAHWLNDYLAAKTKSKMNEMAMIIRGMMRAYDGAHTDKLIKEAFHFYLQHTYLERAFRNTAAEGREMRELRDHMDGIYGQISRNHNFEFTKIIDNLVRIVMMENKPVMQLNAAQKMK